MDVLIDFPWKRVTLTNVWHPGADFECQPDPAASVEKAKGLLSLSNPKQRDWK